MVNGMIFGIGRAADGVNEIRDRYVAALRYAILGWDFCSLSALGGFAPDFGSGTQGNNYAQISSGIVTAYGYCGVLTEAKRFYFNIPQKDQYWFIFARLDLSRTPAVFSVLAKNNYASPVATWRQDVLSAFPTGVFEYPILRVTVRGGSGVHAVTGQCPARRRGDTALTYGGKQAIADAQFCTYTETVSGQLASAVTGFTAAETDASTKIATTKFCDRASLASV